MFNKILIGLATAGVLYSGTATAQETVELKNKKDSKYSFTIVKDIEATDVQSQGRTGTCWSFSALSFFESELMRMGKGKHNLSEMFIVRNAYVDKAVNYVRMHGKFNFGAGGAFHDIPIVIRKYGIVPEEVYKGQDYGDGRHNHSEMDGLLEAMADVVVENPQKKLTPSWQKAFNAVLDAYLGSVPEKFEYQGKKYTPTSFAKELGLNMDDYVVISSFTHHPFYEQFVLEVPDNWAFGQVYNMPLDEMVETMDYAINKGISLAWASDVSEKGFSFRDGLAIVPKDPSTIRVRGRDNQHFSDAGAEKKSSAFDEPVEELKITQELRQEAFDNYETTDDHGMHITGIVTDQNGAKYYIVKNSWGTTYNECDGYFYASEAFVRYKTMNVMLHKDGIPKKIAKKLGIK
ncbi:MAG: C1 family peptidase [Saprospiraceae bacterium]|nr:C1 family peptidase [Saprospiraceae bacterium]